MAIVVKMPASELPVKVEDLTGENFIKVLVRNQKGILFYQIKQMIFLMINYLI